MRNRKVLAFGGPVQRQVTAGIERYREANYIRFTVGRQMRASVRVADVAELLQLGFANFDAVATGSHTLPRTTVA